MEIARLILTLSVTFYCLHVYFIIWYTAAPILPPCIANVHTVQLPYCLFVCFPGQKRRHASLHDITASGRRGGRLHPSSLVWKMQSTLFKDILTHSARENPPLLHTHKQKKPYISKCIKKFKPDKKTT